MEVLNEVLFPLQAKTGKSRSGSQRDQQTTRGEDDPLPQEAFTPLAIPSSHAAPLLGAGQADEHTLSSHQT